MDLKALLEADPGQITQGFVETDTATRPATATTDVEGDWLCAWCLNPVANERDRFKYDDRDEFNFVNPGYTSNG